MFRSCLLTNLQSVVIGSINTVWKNEKFSLTKTYFVKISNSLVTYLVKSLLSRNFLSNKWMFIFPWKSWSYFIAHLHTTHCEVWMHLAMKLVYTKLSLSDKRVPNHQFFHYFFNDCGINVYNFHLIWFSSRTAK